MGGISIQLPHQQRRCLDGGSPGAVPSNDSDADSISPSAVKVTDPSHGTLTLDAAGSFTYTPAADYSGLDSFTYKANDGADESNVATVRLTVAPLPPVISIRHS